MALRPLPQRPQVSEQEENWGYMAPDLLIFPFQPENAPKVCKQLEVKGKGCPPPPLRKEAIREAAAEGTRPAGPRGGVSGCGRPSQLPLGSGLRGPRAPGGPEPPEREQGVGPGTAGLTAWGLNTWVERKILDHYFHQPLKRFILLGKSPSIANLRS